MFFRGREFTIFGSLEPVKPRIRECVKFGNLDLVKKWGHEHAEARNLELSMERTSEDGRFGDSLRTQFGSHAWRHSRTDGFRVWTSGRFVNMLDEKDILVCIHTRNIPWGWGCFRHVKVPSSPYKRGHKGTCKQMETLWNLCYLQRESQSLCALTLYLNVLRTVSCVRVVIRIFRVTPQHWRPPQSSRKETHDATSEEI
jgi:hypothetical protein